MKPDPSRCTQALSFILAVNDEAVFRSTALASPVFQPGHVHEILAERGFASAGAAYNDGIDRAGNNLLVFMHQDVYLPAGWDIRFLEIVESLDASDNAWGVVGCSGVSWTGEVVGHVYCNGNGRVIGGDGPPSPVQSLDELLLGFRKDRGLRFDPLLPGFHLYGADICLEAKRQGLRNYAIGNFCVHNSQTYFRLPPVFWEGAEYLRRKWPGELPLRTTCAAIYPRKNQIRCMHLRSELGALKKRLAFSGAARVSDPERLVEKMKSPCQKK